MKDVLNKQMQQSTMWWILFGFIIVFIILLILLLTGSSFQVVNNMTQQPTTTLGSNTSQVLFASQTLAPGDYKFVFRPRPTGSTIRLWNATTEDITLYNDLLNSGNDLVHIGASDLGVLPSNRTTLCINQDGISTGTGTTGSWRCTEPQEF